MKITHLQIIAQTNYFDWLTLWAKGAIFPEDMFNILTTDILVSGDYQPPWTCVIQSGPSLLLGYQLFELFQCPNVVEDATIFYVAHKNPGLRITAKFRRRATKPHDKWSKPWI